MTAILSPEGEFIDRWYNKVCLLFRVALLDFWNNMSELFFFFMPDPVLMPNQTDNHGTTAGVLQERAFPGYTVPGKTSRQDFMVT
jgi:hypothetical protein